MRYTSRMRYPVCALLPLLFAACHTASPRTASEFFQAPPGPLQALPFSEAVAANGFLFVAGQIGTLPGTLDLAAGGIAAESAQALANLQAVLERHVGHTLPSDANVHLVLRWRQLCDRGLPSLVVMADQHLAAKYCRRIVGSFPKSCLGAISTEFLLGTNHILTGGDARRLVGEAAQRWLAGLQRRSGAARGPVSSVAAGT